MSATPAAIHAFLAELRKTVNEAPNKYGMDGSEVFAGMMHVLCETIAKSPPDMRRAILGVIHDNIDTAVMFESNKAGFIFTVAESDKRH